MTQSVIRTLLTSLVAVGVFLLCAGSLRAQSAGETLFKTKCAACHGPDGKGEVAMGKTMKVKDFASEEVQKMSDTDLSDAITKGKGKMPAYEALTPDQVKDLVGYVRTFGKKK